MKSLNVSSPADLISAVPFMIGFHPADSLVVAAVNGCEFAFAVRIDLPEVGAPPEHVRVAVLHLAMVVAQQGLHRVAVLGYGEPVRVAPAVAQVSEALRRLGLTVLDELRVADGRYWSYLCADPSCCPKEGLPCPPPDSVVAAEATFAGAVALPDRSALAAQLAPPTGPELQTILAATARAGIRLAALAGEAGRPSSDAPGAADQFPDPADDLSGTAGGLPDLEGDLSEPWGSLPWRERDPFGPEGDVGGCPGLPPGLDDDVLRLISEGLRAADGDRPGNAPPSKIEFPELDPDDLDTGRLAQMGPRRRADHPDQFQHPVQVGRQEQVGRPERDGSGSDSDGRGLRDVELPPVSDQPRFYQLVRQAGRTAVREAERRYRAGRRLTDDEIAWLGLLLLHLPVRDYAWTRSRKQEWEVALWSDVVRRVDPRYAPAPASLLAFAAWRTGAGALASIAVERALTQQADYSLAILLHEVLLCGLPPAMLDDWPAINSGPAAARAALPDGNQPPTAGPSGDRARGIAPTGDRPTAGPEAGPPEGGPPAVGLEAGPPEGGPPAVGLEAGPPEDDPPAVGPEARLPDGERPLAEPGSDRAQAIVPKGARVWAVVPYSDRPRAAGHLGATGCPPPSRPDEARPTTVRPDEAGSATVRPSEARPAAADRKGRPARPRRSSRRRI